MHLGPVLVRFNGVLNRVVVPVLASRRWRGLLEGRVAMITYTGRRSGRRHSTPVMYRRSGERVTVQVALADDKSWWRNFLGGGGPVTLQLAGGDRTGHAFARRTSPGMAEVVVDLDPTPAPSPRQE